MPTPNAALSGTFAIGGDLVVNRLGFGAMRVTGSGIWGEPVDAAEARRTLARVPELGINFIDTADSYGPEVSERLIGEVLRELGARDRVVVASKVPPLDGRWPPDPRAPLDAVFPPDHVVRTVEESLTRLRLDALPIEQLHVWLDDWLDAPAWPALRDTMERLTREGKVLHWGISVNDHAPGTALRALAEPIIETVQVIYNIFDRSAEAELLPRAAAHRVGVIARVPFDEGALVGAVRPDSTFDPADFRSRYFRGERRAEVAARVDRLRALLGAEAATLPELALRFCLSRPEVSSVIPGMRRLAHVERNLAAADGRRLSPELLARLAEHAWDKNWYEWP
ncbi:MAG TPA: aldo/keto reductase [Kofleriaceae bacterium]|nr:aldo/keto reductase [Kofleriaceae bacterium]